MSQNHYQDQLDNLKQNFTKNGYAIIENLLAQDEIESMRKEALRLIKEESKNHLSKLQVFGNDFVKSKYFLDSSDQICYFFEKDAVNMDTMKLQLPEEQSIAKIGHALHNLNPVFKDLTFSHKIKDIYRAIGYENPVVIQSMVNFKNPKVGGAYDPHQDAAYLYTEPVHVAGVWIPLDDATAENGCLEFIPGSHKWPVMRRLMRTENTEDGENLLEWTAPPFDTKDEQFVKVPAKKGDVLVLDGKVVHRSAANISSKPRWIYTFHAYDKGRCVYDTKNWLQLKPNQTFLPIYAN